ncbi:MAG TPA: hypothetical protein VFR40_01380, partial [Lapillicoccus sp.]|nr:hypothetical protein [Lapillicoccus sp.]
RAPPVCRWPLPPGPSSAPVRPVAGREQSPDERRPLPARSSARRRRRRPVPARSGARQHDGRPVPVPAGGSATRR